MTGSGKDGESWGELGRQKPMRGGSGKQLFLLARPRLCREKVVIDLRFLDSVHVMTVNR